MSRRNAAGRGTGRRPLLLLSRSLCLVLLIVASCKRAPTTSEGTSTSTSTTTPSKGRLVGDTCELPLSMACEGKPCPSYDAALAELRQLRTNPKEWGRATAGSCTGGRRFLAKSVWYMHVISYFDAKGTMIGAEQGVDNLGQFCDGRAGHAAFGVVPEKCSFDAPTEVVLDGGTVSP